MTRTHATTTVHERPEDVRGSEERNRVIPEGTKHWRSVRDAEGIETLILDRVDSNNTLSRDVLTELGDIVERIESDLPRGLILTSGKSDHFAYGGDVDEFRHFTESSEVLALLDRVHKIFDRLEALDCPSVALIRGACLGGGLELALACTHRVASDNAKIGFPEVNLGIHPGFGGTARAVNLLLAPKAMQIMLTGKILRAQQAKKLGLVDEVQPERHLESSARHALARGFPPPYPHWQVWLANRAPIRAAAAEIMRRKAAEKAPPQHYRAPYALIELWRRNGGNKEKMLAAERQSVANLITEATAQNLIRVFFLRERLKKTAKQSNREIARVHVIGAGTMGGDIAAWCALQGFHVSLSDLDQEQIARAIARADDLFAKKLSNGAKRRDAHDRLMPDPNGNGLRCADLIIEAVAEDLEVKKAVFTKVVRQAREDAILATNTSAIPLAEIAEAVDRPQRLLGLHFFNPVAKLPLIEVVRGEDTEDETVAACAAFVTAIEKLPLPVKSAPGFLVNRALTPYMLEAVKLLEEGHDPESVDRAAEAFGMPMGPVELADSVGLDICLDVSERLAEHFVLESPKRLHELVKSNRLGKKTGQGFYVWKNGKAQKKGSKGSKEEANAALDSDRLILPMLNACAACLREGVVEDAELADAGMIFGTGFAPFTGGPMFYAENRGREAIAERLQTLAERHGERFTPDPFWSNRGDGSKD